MAQLEPCEKILISKEFIEEDSHGSLSCARCHNGDETATDKVKAHTGLVCEPSKEYEKYCSECHSGDYIYSTLSDFSTSLHRNQAGFYYIFEKRAGFDIRDNAEAKGHFDKECGKCHTSCGQCHITRPLSAGSGFISGHKFEKTPDMVNNCTACHGSRVGSEFLGQNDTYSNLLIDGTLDATDDADYVEVEGDTHRFGHYKKCEFCHFDSEMHRSGNAQYRYDPKNETSITCEFCHSLKSTANNYHEAHWSGNGSKLACQVCHSQPYKSCNGCHVGSGITGSSYQTFKIAKNYLKSDSRPYDFILVRHIPIAPDTYAEWGFDDLADFESEPTWRLTTPHNIQRWTAQTNKIDCKDATTPCNSTTCSVKCHRNTDIYLLEADITKYNDSSYSAREIEANESLFMDATSPAGP